MDEIFEADVLNEPFDSEPVLSTQEFANTDNPPNSDGIETAEDDFDFSTLFDVLWDVEKEDLKRHGLSKESNICCLTYD